ncbi:MAG: hypothetical protein EA369_09020 [Bradymonadales bacterium]|nr:MAG: hypothetical protein EA369_09020 [Bradymonadales bacterium]
MRARELSLVMKPSPSERQDLSVRFCLRALERGLSLVSLSFGLLFCISISDSDLQASSESSRSFDLKQSENYPQSLHYLQKSMALSERQLGLIRNWGRAGAVNRNALRLQLFEEFELHEHPVLVEAIVSLISHEVDDPPFFKEQPLIPGNNPNSQEAGAHQRQQNNQRNWIPGLREALEDPAWNPDSTESFSEEGLKRQRGKAFLQSWFREHDDFGEPLQRYPLELLDHSIDFLFVIPQEPSRGLLGLVSRSRTDPSELRSIAMGSILGFLQLQEEFPEFPAELLFRLASAWANLPGNFWALAELNEEDWGWIRSQEEDLLKFFYEAKEESLEARYEVWASRRSQELELNSLQPDELHLSLLPYSEYHQKKQLRVSRSRISSMHQVAGLAVYKTQEGLCAIPVTGTEENSVMRLQEVSALDRTKEGLNALLKERELSERKVEQMIRDGVDSQRRLEDSAQALGSQRLSLESEKGVVVEFNLERASESSCIWLESNFKLKPYQRSQSPLLGNYQIELPNWDAPTNHILFGLEVQDQQGQSWRVLNGGAYSIFKETELGSCPIYEEILTSFLAAGPSNDWAGLNFRAEIGGDEPFAQVQAYRFVGGILQVFDMRWPLTGRHEPRLFRDFQINFQTQP